MYTHPRVYVDTAVIDYILPRAEFHRYLQRIPEAGFGKRVMFGSDQMVCGRERLSARRSAGTSSLLTEVRIPQLLSRCAMDPSVSTTYRTMLQA